MYLYTFLTLLQLIAVLCEIQYNYTVNDTIGTEVFHTTMDEILIYNTQIDDCQVFNFTGGELRFNRVYDFNVEFPDLELSCHVILNNSIIQTIYVMVNDTNDHTPVFPTGEFLLYVDEQILDHISMSNIILPKATDPDLSSFGVTTYTLYGDTDDLKYFTLLKDPPQLMPTNMPSIDRENRSSFHFNLTASDGGTPPRISSVVSINILVNDLNDNSPSFLPHISFFRISEEILPGHILSVFAAEDLDSGSNADVLYRLSSQIAYKDGIELNPSEYRSSFQINATSGQVQLTQELEFEKFDKIVLIVEAADSGQPPLSNSIIITVYVDHLIDSIPELIFTNTNSDNVHEVSENTEPSNRLLLIYFQSPLPENFTASLTLLTYPDNSTDTQPFSIYRVTQNWVLNLSQELDREAISQYEFTVLLEVNLSLSSSKSSRYRLTVQVLDTNDNSPQFHNLLSGCVHIPENFTGLILTPEVYDNDTGTNAQLTFSISIFPSEYAQHFSINNSSGELRVVEELDYEEVNEFVLKLTVTDGGTPSFSNNTEWSLCLDNINDNPILFNLSSPTISVPANSLLHTRLLTLHASDRDNITAPIFYHLFGNKRTFFLNPTTGDLILNACLKHVQVTQLQVSASHCPNASNYSAQCEISHINITVEVTDTVFLLQHSVYTICLQKDSTTNYVRLFSLGINNLNETHFQSSFESSLSTDDNHVYLNSSTSLLQEKCSEYLSCNITLSHACDSNHTEQTLLNFLFLEEPVSSIQFSQSSYYIFSEEGYYEKSTVQNFSKLICSDINIAVNYSLSGGSVPPNLTLTQSGTLVLFGTVDIDFPNATTNYRFTIEARQNDVTASATVIFQINATNDNSPQFSSPIGQLVLNSSYHLGQSVAGFTAEDRDVGSDTQLRYKLSIELDWLVTDKFTGFINIAKNIDSYAPSDRNMTLNATITVSDGGSPSRNSSHSFSVIIGERFELIRPPRPPSYWYIPVASVCLLVLLLTVLVAAVLVLVSVCRYKFCFSANLRLDSTKSSRVWEVLENSNVAYVCGSVTQNGGDTIVDSISKSTKSSGLGISIDSSPSLVVPMTDEEIKRIIDSNRDLMQQLGSAPQLQDYNEDSPAPPTLAGEDSDLHLVFSDELSLVSISNGDKGSQDESPIDIIFANPDTRFLCPSHSPQSSASSSYLSSVSHQRPKMPYNVPHPRDAAKKPEVGLAPLPSASTPSFSQKAPAALSNPTP